MEGRQKLRTCTQYLLGDFHVLPHGIIIMPHLTDEKTETRVCEVPIPCSTSITIEVSV